MKDKINKKVHFSIDGKWVADFARTRVEEGDYQHSLRILDCLEGMGMDDKISILKGEKDLMGVNSIYLVEADPTLKQSVDTFYQRQYGTLLQFENRYYTPYMIVNSWSMDDLPEENTQLSTFSKKLTQQFEPELYDKMNTMFGGSKLNGYPHSRSLHYAYHPQDDLAFSFHREKYQKNEENYDSGVILFKEFKEQIPFWVASYIKKNPQDSIQSFLEHKNYLIQNGAEYLYDKKYFSNDALKIDNPLVSGEKYYELENDDEDHEAYEDLRKKISDYADNDKEYGWKTFSDQEGNTIRVPGRAFMHFALKRFAASWRGADENAINLHDYQPISKSGLKMGGDDPYHTDCWLGANLPLNAAYDHDCWQYKLFMGSVWNIQDREFDQEFNTITSANNLTVSGFTVNTNNYHTVPKGQRILILPNLSVDFEQAFFACDHIICETGGKLAHLATLAREFNKSILRIENATLKFLRKKPITVDFKNGTIHYDIDYKETETDTITEENDESNNKKQIKPRK